MESKKLSCCCLLLVFLLLGIVFATCSRRCSDGDDYEEEIYVVEEPNTSSQPPPTPEGFTGVTTKPKEIGSYYESFQSGVAGIADQLLTTDISGNFVSRDPLTNTFYCDPISNSCTQPFPAASHVTGLPNGTQWTQKTDASGNFQFATGMGQTLMMDSSGNVTIPGSLTATGNVNSVNGNLLVNNTPVINTTTIGSQIINSGLQNTSNSSFKIGSFFSVLSPLSNFKIDGGQTVGGSASGTINYNITFSVVYITATPLVSSNNYQNQYLWSVAVTGTSPTNWTYSVQRSAIVGNSTTNTPTIPGFFWMAIGY